MAAKNKGNSCVEYPNRISTTITMQTANNDFFEYQFISVENKIAALFKLYLWNGHKNVFDWNK